LNIAWTGANASNCVQTELPIRLVVNSGVIAKIKEV